METPRNRRFGSHENARSGLNLEEKSKSLEKKQEDGWWFYIISWMKILVCFVGTMFTTFIWTVIILLLLPWPSERIRQSNIFAHVTARFVLWILGNPIKVEGAAEYTNQRAIYLSNHTSPLDAFLLMWLIPTGTVAIAKKEVIWYPLLGQFYVLANHLRIDRSNPASAIESLKEVAHAVVKNNLSLLIFPEGTRSKNGRLLPFKKGFIHLAVQTKLPIVPIVLIDTHVACKKGSMHVRPVPLTVKFLPPIRTEDWTANKIEDYVKLVQEVYVQHLPVSQRPL